MKIKITGDEYGKLSDEMKKNYKKVGDAYHLDLEDYDDPEELRRAKDREAEDRKRLSEKYKNTQKELEELKAKLEEREDDESKKKGEWDKIEERLRKQHAKEIKERDDAISSLKTGMVNEKIDATATELAAKISTSPRIMKRHILDRLKGEIGDDGRVKVTVLGADGTPSAMSLENLEKEFLADKDFSSILVASKASGGAGPSYRDRAGGRHDEPPNNNRGGSGSGTENKPANSIDDLIGQVDGLVKEGRGRFS